MKKFALITYNVWSKNFTDKNMLNTDLILTQEEPKKMSYISNYKRNILGKGGERLGLYYKDDIKIEKKIITNTEIEGCSSRCAMIFMYKSIKIANLHLEGGGICDKYLLKNYDEILYYKLNLINKVLDEKPDIICGDFNSVYSKNNNLEEKFLLLQYKYFSKFSESDDLKKKIFNWNKAPYKLLEKAKYIYAEPINEFGNVTSYKGNSIVDCVWYNNNKLQLNKCEIINFSNNKSDHNPVRVNFSIL